MNLTITQDNLYLLLPSKVGRMACLLAEDKGLTIVEAIQLIYASQTYKQLEREETKLWHLGPVALYEELLEELEKAEAGKSITLQTTGKQPR